MRTTLSVLFLLAIISVTFGGAGPERKPKFTVSKETTYLTEPVDKDGFLDYAAALNDRLSKGVKPEDNAVVVFCQVFGPRPEGAKMSPTFYKRLGIKEPAEKGEYLQYVIRFASEHLKIDTPEGRQEILDQSDQAREKPWTGPQFPVLAQWLKANETALALAIEATKRPRYYYPLLPSETEKGREPLISCLVPGVQKCRELCNTLLIRAMLHLGEGRPEEAWQDLLACHRLGRSVARGGSLIEGLVGIAIDHIASHADLTFLEHAKLDAKQVKECLRDLQALPPMPTLAEKLDGLERLMFLDAVMMVNRDGLGHLEDISLAARGKVLGFLPEKADVDWDPALREANRWYDRLATALREKERPARMKRLREAEEILFKLKDDLEEPEKLSRALSDPKATPQARGQILGKVMLGFLGAPLSKVQGARDRNEQIERNLHLAFALAAYQREHGKYPGKLEALAPTYLAKVPRDLFTGKDLIYHPSKTGYLLYSVGANELDEGGRTFDADPAGDDLRVLVAGRGK